jgi:uncharacterized NAD(P)/FAD-binding protein YdhS
MDKSQATTPMNRPSVAIIGGGCSGTLVALQLLKQSGTIPLDIIIVERSGSIGTGLAYSVPSDVCKLNVPANAMGAFPDEPQGFFSWLQQRELHSTGEAFVSRRLFGEYLKDLLTTYSKDAHHTTVTAIADSACDLTWDESRAQFRIDVAKTAPIHSDFCVLAVGNIERESLDGVLIKDTFSSPYEQASYQSIEKLSKILVVGSGLTAIDLILEAESRGFRGTYTMVSRHGRIPLAHEDSANFANITLDASLSSLASLTSLSLQSLVKLVRTESTRIGSSQPVIAAVRPHIQSIWAALSDMDKRRFLRHVRPLWEVHRHRIPRPHWETVQSLRSSKRLRIVSGRVKSASRCEAGIEATIISKDTTKKDIFDKAFICAGPEGDLTKVQMPLIQRLISRGIITPGKLRLGVAPSQTSLPTVAASRLEIIGPLQREALWEITAVRELRIYAEKIAANVLATAREALKRQSV